MIMRVAFVSGLTVITAGLAYMFAIGLLTR
jgi:hypothetical protein